MAEPLMIAGIVTDQAGHPVTGAVVAIAAAPVPVPDIAAVTGEGGRFSIDVPVAGDYRLTVRAGDWWTEAEVAVGPGRETVRIRLGERQR